MGRSPGVFVLCVGGEEELNKEKEEELNKEEGEELNKEEGEEIGRASCRERV